MKVIGGAPWHTEFYANALKEIVEKTGVRCIEKSCNGWLDWFENTHPALYKKYDEAQALIDKLWGSNVPADREAFKKAVRIEVEAYAFAVPKFLETRKCAAVPEVAA
jgi:hypothetical protein